jgi:hypothetical protein
MIKYKAPDEVLVTIPGSRHFHHHVAIIDSRSPLSLLRSKKFMFDKISSSYRHVMFPIATREPQSLPRLRAM